MCSCLVRTLLVFGKIITAGNRIVHFDLKGAAPNLEYFLELIRNVKTLGATGLLIEWEDMFPYEGKLEQLRSGNAYTRDEVRQILRTAKEQQLDVIPLVQTFGHLEWILKYEQFAHLRQVKKYPQVICLADDDAVDLVKTAIDQVIALHREHGELDYFHMGADEARQVGECAKDQAYMAAHFNGSRPLLMLWHINRINRYIRKRSPNTRVLMWYDMLVSVPDSVWGKASVDSNIEPVVWNYWENTAGELTADLWQRLAQRFPFVWGATAFKGANGSAMYTANIPHYLHNHQSWQVQMTNNYHRFRQFRGLILTGWQRYVCCVSLTISQI